MAAQLHSRCGLRHIVSLVRGRVCWVVAVLALGAAPAAQARDDSIKSFDGTTIVLSFFPAQNLKPGQKTPTVLFGPGWSQSRDTDENSSSEELFGTIGIGPLRRAGYNALTWDPRGFGQSGGTVTADGPDNEARDVQALFDYVAKQPEALLDAPGDPRVGMTGASYGGGIQLTVAGIDDRLDAIVPDIAWHSLGTALYKDSTFKGGWGNVLFATGVEGGIAPGLVPGPGGIQTGHLDPHIYSAYSSGQSTGHISEEDRRWFLSRGPGDLVNRIRIPTFFTQGTVDTLFTLDEATTNYAILRRNGVPTKMMWFCGGHGSCLTNPGPAGRLEGAAIRWLDRYLKRNTSVGTGPRFEWLDQNGKTYSQSDYPLYSLPPAVATGSGTLVLNAGTSSGAAIAASQSSNSVDVPVPSPPSPAFWVGAPKLALTYSGTAGSTDTRVYAQIVDQATGVVLGNQVTPIPVRLDGKEHELMRPLEQISVHTKPGSGFTLQLVPGSTVYDAQRTSGVVSFSAVRLLLPSVDPTKPPPGYGRRAARVSLKILRVRYLRSRRGHRRLAVLVQTRGGKVRNVVVRVRGKRRRLVGRSRPPRTFSGRRRFVLRLRRGAGRRRYRVQATGRRPDGSAVRAAKRIPRSAVRGRR
jgi:ABC-2 type transport system ATP-binding protein